MKTALFPGTFDPPTIGHHDIIQRAVNLFDKIYVGIAINTSKRDPAFTIAEKKVLLEVMVAPLSQVEIITFSDLVVDCAQKLKVDCLLRGLRTYSDFEYECQMAAANHKMIGIETVFLMSDNKHVHISSTLIREIANCGRRLHGFVPEVIEDAVFKKFANEVVKK
jgi:pantetheine-phosphate adenylyltransferase